MSMKPGATTCPAASMTRRAGPVRPLARALMRPSQMAISTARPGVPLPSMTWAPRIMRSSIVSLPLSSQAALCWRRTDVTAASCGTAISSHTAPTTALYGSGHRKGTQHTTAEGLSTFSSPTPHRPIHRSGETLWSGVTSAQEDCVNGTDSGDNMGTS